MVTTKELYKSFANRGLTMEDANTLVKLIKSDRDVDFVMKYLNEQIDGYGVDAIRDERAWVNTYYGNTIGVYVGLGDTYTRTLIYDTENKEYLIASVGDFVEDWESDREFIDKHWVNAVMRGIHGDIEEAMGKNDFEFCDSNFDEFVFGNESTFEMEFERTDPEGNRHTVTLVVDYENDCGW